MSELLHRFQPSAVRWWSKYAPQKSKMANGHQIKNRKIAIPL